MGTLNAKPSVGSLNADEQRRSRVRPQSPGKRKRAHSDENWAFEHVSLDELGSNPSFTSVSSNTGPLCWPVPRTHPPVYILEASLDDQALWHSTAGQRPAQPPDERKYYENLYKNNFEKSEALKGGSTFDDVCIDKASIMRRETSEQVLFRGKGPFSYAVSKSFLYCSPPCMTLQVASFIFISSFRY
jgi:hypothetical protein